MAYHPAYNHYPLAASEDALIERREAREDVRVDLDRQRVEIERQAVKAQERTAKYEALQTFALVALPVAAFFGIDRLFKRRR